MFQSVSLHPTLIPYIKDIRIQDSDAQGESPSIYTIFPSPYPVMGFQYQGQLNLIHNEKVIALAYKFKRINFKRNPTQVQS